MRNKVNVGFAVSQADSSLRVKISKTVTSVTSSTCRSASLLNPMPFVSHLHRGDEPSFANEHPRFRRDPSRMHNGFLKRFSSSLSLFLSRHIAILVHIRSVQQFRFVCRNGLKQHRCPLCSDDVVDERVTSLPLRPFIVFPDASLSFSLFTNIILSSMLSSVFSLRMRDELNSHALFSFTGNVERAINK